MATLAGQRAQFTWALNQYNLTEDAEVRAHFAKRMAKYIAAAPTHGFTAELVTQGKSYPAEEVAKYLNDPTTPLEPDISEESAVQLLNLQVDTNDVFRTGEGASALYAYGYRCASDRLKIGITNGDTVERIADQIWTSTPDKPVLFLEIRTHNSRGLEKAVHAVLEARGKKVAGGGAEWFKTDRDEVLEIYRFVHDDILSNQHSRSAQKAC
jgi:hypothetical protein